MVTEHATITFYNINKCGFYMYGKSTPSFGTVESMLSDLSQWAVGKTLKQTKTFSSSENALPAYLIDARQQGDNFLVILWNEVPSSDQNIPSVSENTRFGGGANVILNEIKKGSIPGFATYFWFIPSKDLVATIKLKHVLTGHKSMQNYMYGFLSKSSQHVVSEMIETEDGEYEIKVKGYSEVPNSGQLTKKRHIPYFVTNIMKNPGEHDFILRNVNNLSKIEKVIELDLSRPEEVTLWQKLLEFTRVSKQQLGGVSTKIRYEISPNATLSDIKNMIKDWDAYGDSQGCDYGFVIKGSPQVYWLSRSLARARELALNIQRTDEEFIEPNSLLNELIGKRKIIFNAAGI